MKLRLSNIGALPDIDLSIEGLTVITGINSTGKSTLLKSVYCAFQPSHGFEDAKTVESAANLRSIIQNGLGIGSWSMDSTVDQLLKQAKSIDDARLSEKDRETLVLIEALLDGRRDREFYQMRVEDAIRSEFGSLSQMVNLRKGGHARVSIDSREGSCGFKADSDSVSWDGPVGRLPDIIYYDSPFVLDGQWVKPVLRDHRDVLSLMLHQNGRHDTLQAMLNRSKRKRFDSLMDGVIEGELTEGASGYVTRDGIKVDIRNMAAGMKVFTILRALADKGYLGGGCVLLLDEPEIHLHPLWINILAGVIAALVADMGVKVVMTTHNPQLLMALEGEIADHGVHADFYNLSRKEGGIEFAGPLDDLQAVYAEMVGPVSDAGSRFLEV